VNGEAVLSEKQKHNFEANVKKQTEEKNI